MVYSRAFSGAPFPSARARYKNISQLLAGFDLDCCSFGFDMSGGKVYCTPRAKRALEHRVNIIASQHFTRCYMRRLEKYALRGFAIGCLGIFAIHRHPSLALPAVPPIVVLRLCGNMQGVPGMAEGMISRELLSSSYLHIPRYDLLLRVVDYGKPGSTDVQMNFGKRDVNVRCMKR